MKNIVFKWFCSWIMLSSCWMAAASATTPISWTINPTPVTNGELPMTADGQGIFGDFNNDGILDFFIIAGQGTGYFGLYKGNGDGTFTQIENDELYGKNEASAAFIDFDNDGNLDLITIGKDDTGVPVTDFFINTGAPDYKFVWDMELSMNFPFLSVGGASHNPRAIMVFDYNKDGWSDLLITGYPGGVWEDGNGETRVVAIFKNTGSGYFEYVANPVDGTDDFEPTNGGSVDVADFDQDGWMDILVSGYRDGVGGLSGLYKNNGNGTFSRIEGIDFVGQYQGETAFIDMNNDGYADILEVGRNLADGSWAGFSKVFINNTDGTFTRYEESQTNVGGVGFALAIGDINNDGLVDFLASGWGSNNKVYYNNGDGFSFTSQDFPRDAVCRQGSVCFADINKDGFLDLHFFGYHDGDEGYNTYGYWPDLFALNAGGEGIVANQAPTVPANLNISYDTGKSCYNLTWDKSTDDTTPQDAIRYNIYIKYPEGKIYCLVPADIETGTLKVAGQQAFIPTNNYSVFIPETEDIEIAVQAVDNGWKTSAFSKFNATGIEEIRNMNVEIYTYFKKININNHSSGTIQYTVFTPEGRTVETGKLYAKTKIISKELNKGIYLIKINDGMKYNITKILISDWPL